LNQARGHVVIDRYTITFLIPPLALEGSLPRMLFR